MRHCIWYAVDHVCGRWLNFSLDVDGEARTKTICGSSTNLPELILGLFEGGFNAFVVDDSELEHFN
jgi:hypothetical protein